MHLFDTCKKTILTISETFAGFGIVGEMLLKYCKSLLYKELNLNLMLLVVACSLSLRVSVVF